MHLSHDALLGSHIKMIGGYWEDAVLDADDERRILDRVLELLRDER